MVFLGFSTFSQGVPMGFPSRFSIGFLGVFYWPLAGFA